MGRAKELWERDCEQICEDYQSGKICLDRAIKELLARGWDRDQAADALSEGKPAPPITTA